MFPHKKFWVMVSILSSTVVGIRVVCIVYKGMDVIIDLMRVRQPAMVRYLFSILEVGLFFGLPD